MDSENSEFVFFLIDKDGHRRIPQKIRADHGPFGYALHPDGKGNDPKAAHYTEDLKQLVQDVVLYGRGVRAKAKSGPQKGQLNTLGLAKKSIAGYWLTPGKLEWVDGAQVRPVNEVVPA